MRIWQVVTFDGHWFIKMIGPRREQTCFWGVGEGRGSEKARLNQSVQLQIPDRI